ncbi:MAG TPA: hypothetical protein PKE16_07500 [Hyphomicrobium sp.]|nr:hypothetical protein [Hyphomicrobium sp.]
MRLILALLFISVAGLNCQAGVADSATKAGKFQICKTDDPKNCGEATVVTCAADAGVLASYRCQKQGWNFFTLAKVKEVPGGQCGSTIYDVKCE